MRTTIDKPPSREPVEVEVLQCDLCDKLTEDVWSDKKIDKLYGQGWFCVYRSTQIPPASWNVDLCPECAMQLIPDKVRRLVESK